MVAIVGGGGLGLLNGSGATLGSKGQQGSAAYNRYGDNVYVNAATGNLVLQHRDEFLASVGQDIDVTRTYNSRGDLSDDNGDNWKLSLERNVRLVSGQAGKAFSTALRVAGDGSVALYQYDATMARYVTTDGAGGFDTLAFDATSGNWTWQSGSSSIFEVYDGANNGRIVTSADGDGNTLSFGYDADGMLKQVTDQTGGGTFFHYDTTSTQNLLSVEVYFRPEPTAANPAPALVSSKLVSYSYDAGNRLERVETTVGPGAGSGSMSTFRNGSVTLGGTGGTIGEGGTGGLNHIVDPRGGVPPSSVQFVTYTNTTGQAIQGPIRLNILSIDGAPSPVGGPGQLTNVQGSGDSTVGWGTTVPYTIDSGLSALAPGATVIFNMDFASSWPTARTLIFNVTGVTAPPPITYWTEYGYDGASTRVNSIKQKDGSELTIVYDGVSDRVKSISDGLYENSQFDYAGGQLTVTDQLGNSTSYVSNPDGTLASVTVGTGASGLATFYEYDTSGNVELITEPDGNTTVRRYDDRGNCTYERDGAGNVIERSYSPQNLLTSETRYSVADSDADGPLLSSGALTTSFIYDAKEHLRFVIGAEGAVQEYRYNAKGQRDTAIGYTRDYFNANLTEQTQPTLAHMVAWVVNVSDKSRVVRTDYHYDVHGMQDRSTSYAELNADGTIKAGTPTSVQQFTYDQAGRLLQTKEGDGDVTSYVYDGMGRLLTTTNALAEQVKTVHTDMPVLATFNGVSQLVTRTSTTFPNGRETLTTYDKAGRVLQVQDRLAGQPLRTQSYAYDAAGRLLMADDGSGVANYMLYDYAGRKVFDIDADGTTVEYRYNANSQLSQTIVHAGYFDLALYLEEHNMTLAQLTAADVQFEPDSLDNNEWRLYDKAGRLSKVVDSLGYVTETQYDGASRAVRQIRYTNPVEIIDGMPPADPTPEPHETRGWDDDRITRSFYDEDGRLRGQVDGMGFLVEYKYNGAGQLVETARYYDSLGNPEELEGSVDDFRPLAHAKDIHEYRLYDNRGLLVGVVDGENYLTETEYFLDGSVSRTVRYSKVVAYSGQALPLLRPTGADVQTQVLGYGYTRLNQFETRTGVDGTVTRFLYDNAGNLTSTTAAFGTAEARASHIHYDVLGRVLAELSPEGALALAAAASDAARQLVWQQYATSYTYDAAGRRLSMTDANQHRTVYYYNMDGRLAVTVDAGGNVEQRSYTNQNQLSGVRRYATPLDAATVATLTGGKDDTVYDLVFELTDYEHDVSVSYEYDARGQMSALHDASGHQSIIYNGYGEVQETSRAIGDGRFERYEHVYDERGVRWLTKSFRGENDEPWKFWQTDAFGRVFDVYRGLETEYDRNGQVIELKTAAGTIGKTSYDAFGRVLTRDDGLGNITTYDYDTAARKLTITTPEGVTQTIVSNRHGQQHTVTSDTGDVATYDYDVNGQLKSVSDTLGTQLENVYDRAGLLFTSKDANGIATRYDYDAANRVLTRTADMGGLALATSYTYDGAGRVLTVKDPNGVITSTAYNRAGHVESIIQDSADGGLQLLTTFTYDVRGKTLSMTDPNGVLTRYAYDDIGNRVSVSVDPDGLNIETFYRYDDEGNVELRTDARGNATHYIYDLSGRKAGEVDGSGAVTQYIYQGATAVLAQVVRYATRITAEQKAALDSQRNVSEVSGVFSMMAHDADRDQRTYLVYDADGRLRFTVDGAGGVSEQHYDANGRLDETVRYSRVLADPASAAALSCAALSALIASDVAGPSDIVTTYTYDERGRVLQSANGIGGLTTYRYDGNGNVIESTVSAPGIAGSQQRMVHDNAGRLLATATGQFVDPGSDLVSRDDDVLQWAVVRYSYDANGNLTGRVAYAAMLPGSALAANATQDEVTAWIDGVHADTGADSTVAMEYDKLNRLTLTATAEKKVGEQLLWSVTGQTYDANGNVLARTRYGQFQQYVTGTAPLADPASDNTSRFVYDAGNRVAYSVDGLGAVVQLEHDGLGNVTRRTEYANPVLLDELPTAALLERILLARAESADVSGDRVTQYTYDTANRLQVATDALGTSSEHNYDGAGSLIKVRTITPRDGTRIEYRAYDAAGNLRFVVDGEGYVRETVYYGTGLVQKTVQHDPKIVQPQHPPSTQDVEDALAAAELPVTRTRSYVYDAQGNVTTETDGEGHSKHYKYNALGQRVEFINENGARWTYDYDAAGHVVLETNPVTGTTAAGVPVQLLVYTGYDAHGNVISRAEIDIATQVTRTTYYGYDLQGRQTVTTPPVFAVYNAASDTNPAGSAARTEGVPVGAPNIVVTYDALGNAVASKDVGGVVSRKLYDRMGRVLYEIDALQNVTGYEYDGFGNAVKLTRFAASLTDELAATSDRVRVAELYRGLKGVAPDRTGIDFWTRAVPSLGIVDVANGMLNALDPGNTVPLDIFIRDFFSRAAGMTLTPAEQAYWLDIGNTPGRSRGELAVHMLNSIQGEDRVFLNSQVENALHPELASSPRFRVAQLYMAVLGRAASATELVAGQAMLDAGATDAAFARALMTLPEATERYPAEQSRFDFVGRLLYQATGREPGEAAVDALVLQTEALDVEHAVVFVLNSLEGSQSVRGSDGALFEARTKSTLPALALVPQRPLTEFTLANVRAVLDALDHLDDRVLRTQYDHLGRAVRVAESAVLAHDTLGGENEYWQGFETLSRVTSMEYNGFGDLASQSVYGARGDFTQDGSRATPGSYSAYYYNLRGDRIAEYVRVNERHTLEAQVGDNAPLTQAVGGYVTEMEYDGSRNLILRIEHAALAGGSGWRPGDALPPAGEDDRRTSYKYDLSNRKSWEVREGVRVTSMINNWEEWGAGAWLGRPDKQVKDLSTSYTYDRAGNMTHVSGPLGSTTRTYYDSMGRVLAQAVKAAGPGDVEPMRAMGDSFSYTPGVASAGTPTLTTFERDAFGNVTKQVDWANGTGDLEAEEVAPNLASAAHDRVTIYGYDAAGHVIQKTDAEDNVSYTSYDIYGRVAKEWAPVTDYANGGRALVSFKISSYDDLGRLSKVVTPASGSTAVEMNFYAVIETSSMVGDGGESSGYTGDNSVALGFPALPAGEVQIRLTYALPGTGNSGYSAKNFPLSNGQTLTLNEARDGATLLWSDLNTLDGGIKAISGFVVELKVDGVWVVQFNREGVETNGRWWRMDTAAAGQIGANEQVNIYNSFGEVTARSMNGQVFEFSDYDQQGNAWRTNAGDGVTKVRYFNVAGQVTEEVRSAVKDLGVYSSAADARAALTGLAGESGVTTAAWRYDLAGRMVLSSGPEQVDGSIVLEAGQTEDSAVRRPTAYQHVDRWGNVVEVTDPRKPDWSIKYSYNADNQITQQSVNTGGVAVSMVDTYYDDVGRVTGGRDAMGYLTRYKYGEDGRLFREYHEEFGDGPRYFGDTATVQYEYNLFGERESMLQSSGVHTLYAYDNLGHLTSIGTKAVVLWKPEETADGSRVTAQELVARDVVETFSYDQLGRRYQSVNGEGERTQYGYDLAGNLVSTANALGDTVRSAYDAFGHKNVEVDANGRVMRWTMDAQGRASSHVDLAGRTINYGYDGQGRMIRQWSGDWNTVKAVDRHVAYEYTGGLLTGIFDAATGTETSYRYNLSGQRTLEKTVQGGVTVQENHIEYDRQGRLAHVGNSTFDVTMKYDLNGNRTGITSLTAGQDIPVEVHNKFDRRNRETVANGKLNESDEVVIGTNGEPGHEITYNADGSRSSDTYMFHDGYEFRRTVEHYQYDAAGRLSEVRRDGVLVDKRGYDGAGRVVRSGPSGASVQQLGTLGLNDEVRTYIYDDAGRVQRVQTYTQEGVLLNDVFYRDVLNRLYDKGESNGYDRMGNLRGYTVLAGTQAKTFHQQYALFDGYKLSKVTGGLGYGWAEDGPSTVTEYDANGNAVALDDGSAAMQRRSFVNDADGRVLVTSKDGVVKERNLIVNGELFMSDAPNSGWNVGHTYQPVSAAANTAAPSFYQPRPGETLRAIAQAVWGDASLWYLIADANGIDGDAALAVTTPLTLPARVNTVRNGADTFKPYDPAAALGETTPTLPVPSQGGAGGCGAVGKIIAVVIAVVVTYISAGALSREAGAALTAVFGTTGASVAIGAAAAASGSIVSQGVSIAIGVQDSFSWKGVALAAISGGVGGGVTSLAQSGTFGSVFQGAGPGAMAARAALSSIASQGLGIVTGLQSGFNWRGVAASAAGAAMGAAVGDKLNQSRAFGDDFAAGVARATVSGIAGGATTAVFRGGKISIVQIATDAFGNALGSSLAEYLEPEQSSYSLGGSGHGMGFKLGSGMKFGDIRTGVRTTPDSADTSIDLIPEPSNGEPDNASLPATAGNNWTPQVVYPGGIGSQDTGSDRQSTVRYADGTVVPKITRTTNRIWALGLMEVEAREYAKVNSPADIVLQANEMAYAPRGTSYNADAMWTMLGNIEAAKNQQNVDPQVRAQLTSAWRDVYQRGAVEDVIRPAQNIHNLPDQLKEDGLGAFGSTNLRTPRPVVNNVLPTTKAGHAGYSGANTTGTVFGPPRMGLDIPQGLRPATFDRLSGNVRATIDRMGLGDDVFVMGSRAGGTAKVGSDLDIGVRMAAEQFDQMIAKSFAGAKNARAATMEVAVRDGRIQAGEAGLSSLGKSVAREVGLPPGKVQISVIRAGGVFDNGPQSPLAYTYK